MCVRSTYTYEICRSLWQCVLTVNTVTTQTAIGLWFQMHLCSQSERRNKQSQSAQTGCVTVRWRRMGTGAFLFLSSDSLSYLGNGWHDWVNHYKCCIFVHLWSLSIIIVSFWSAVKFSWKHFVLEFLAGLAWVNHNRLYLIKIFFLHLISVKVEARALDMSFFFLPLISAWTWGLRALVPLPSVAKSPVSGSYIKPPLSSLSLPKIRKWTAVGVHFPNLFSFYYGRALPCIHIHLMELSFSRRRQFCGRCRRAKVLDQWLNCALFRFCLPGLYVPHSDCLRNCPMANSGTA